jgi:putative ABC transport system permease protein
MTVISAPSTARLRPQDLGGLASVGLRTRKLRAALSALGISIGVAAIVAVLGLARSSQAGLLAEISELGTNLLTVTNGQSFTGTAELPASAPGMVGELHGVTAVQYTGALSDINAYRSPYIPAIDTNALSVDASSLNLPGAAGTSMAQGTYLNAATENEPVAVLGYAAAQRLGIDRIWPGEKIWVGGMWFYVAGILNQATLAPEIDSSVLVGFPAAERYLGFDGHPSELYVRTQHSQSVTTAVDNLLGYQANPSDPSGVDVSQPSSALTAQADAAGAFDTLFLGLGAVALLVGAVGVANIMIISVLERRQEIGLRRALGATRGQIRVQFLSEAILLSLIGAVAGVIMGVISTAVYAHVKGWSVVIPPEAWAGGLGAALAIGTIAGLLPAIRAARLSPTQALWSLLSRGMGIAGLTREWRDRWPRPGVRPETEERDGRRDEEADRADPDGQLVPRYERMGGRLPVGRPERLHDRADTSSPHVLRLTGRGSPDRTGELAAGIIPTGNGRGHPQTAEDGEPDRCADLPAGVDKRGGRARRALGDIAHRDVGDGGDERAEPAPAADVAKGGQDERGGGAGSAQREDADRRDDATGRHDPGGREPVVEPAGQLGHEHERAVEEEPGQTRPQHRPAVDVLVEQGHVEQHPAERGVADQVNTRGADETASAEQNRRDHRVGGMALPERERRQEHHSDREGHGDVP